MSYINDALHKAQKENKSSWVSGAGIVSSEGKKPAARKKWHAVIGLLLVFFFAAGLVALLVWPDVRKTPRAATIVQNPIDATARSIQGPPPALVLEKPVAAAEIAAPLPAKKDKTSPADSIPALERKEKKQITEISDDTMKQNAPSQPAAVSRESLYAQALQKQREGKLEEAKELYRKVIRIDPRHMQALNNLGVVYLKMKRYKWAVIRFNDALDIKHNYVDAHYNLACLYAQNNDTKKSLSYLKNAIDINPEVRQWAARDEDLKNLADLPGFNKLLQAQDE